MLAFIYRKMPNKLTYGLHEKKFFKGLTSPVHVQKNATFNCGVPRRISLSHLSQEGHWSLASQCPSVESRSILSGHPLPTFVHWWSPSLPSTSEV